MGTALMCVHTLILQVLETVLGGGVDTILLKDLVL